MTVSVETHRVGHVGDGMSVSFAVPFRFVAPADLRVTLAGVVLTLNLHYQVAGGGSDAGGAVVMTAPPPVGAPLVIVRLTSRTQETAYVPNDPFPAQAHEAALDKLTLITQELAGEISAAKQELGGELERTLRVPAGDPATGTMILPGQAARANRALLFDAAGKPAAGPTIAQLNAAILNAQAADSHQGLASAVLYQRDAAGTVVQTVKGVIDAEPLHVANFGAAGDNASDDTAAIQTAIDAFKAGGATLDFDAGRTYRIDGTPYLFGPTNGGFDTFINGRGATLRQMSTASSPADAALKIGSGTEPNFGFSQRVHVQGLHLRGPGSGVDSFGLHANEQAQIYFSYADINSFGIGIRGTGNLTSKYEYLNIRHNEIGYYADPAGGFHPNHIRIADSSIVDNGQAIYQADYSEGLFVLSGLEIAGTNPGGTLEDGKANIDLVAAGWTGIYDMHTEANWGTHGIRYDGASIDDGLLVVNSNLYSSTNKYQITMLNGNLTGINSLIVGNDAGGHGVNLTGSSTAWLINCATNLGGDLSGLSTLNKGRLAFGTNASANQALIYALPWAIDKAGGAVARWRADTAIMQFANAADSTKHVHGFVDGVHAYVLNADDIPFRFILDGANAWAARSGSFGPETDNSKSAGTAALKYSTVYAGSGTIVTSDERMKDWRGGLTAPELAAARDIAGTIGIYQWLYAIAEKGSAAARLHTGVKAQQVASIMAGHGLDPMRYGFVCYDAWEATEAVYAPADRVMVSEAAPGVDAVYEDVPPVLISPAQPAGDRYSIRADELVMFLLAAQEQRLAALEAA